MKSYYAKVKDAEEEEDGSKSGSKTKEKDAASASAARKFYLVILIRIIVQGVRLCLDGAVILP